MLSKHLNRINFPKISAKVEKAGPRKGQMKLLLSEVYTKIKKMRTTDYNDIETNANNTDTRVKLFKLENQQKTQFSSTQFNET